MKCVYITSRINQKLCLGVYYYRCIPFKIKNMFRYFNIELNWDGIRNLGGGSTYLKHNLEAMQFPSVNILHVFC